LPIIVDPEVDEIDSLTLSEMDETGEEEDKEELEMDEDPQADNMNTNSGSGNV
jgi:hypothetical protein